ncbi:alkyl/aryl-sulfatase [Streptacidiphilus jiangxiensis]|uniref:Linear primary-alkylsulfatase n=1 Tax=Streptacidiphilus jiangxiensis TaxID=235985 RepID=A0A1H7ZTW4_STRJI|nr:alkyl sulfatase dimerization domain-containing protein [Streptacidiphilus jiangxiensis]SEM60929.1 Alkyl sulfatase BDS1, metallo-beta-lactamase superfamily [Streptacidiphilus jiangxiensis]
MTTDPRKNATEATRKAHAALAARLPLADDTDFARAQRGLLRRTGDVEVLPTEPPETVNPSLWRQARLNALHGLYEVTDGVYQVRGYDLANVTFVRGADGWIVVDPLTAAETAAAALATLREHFADERPVTAVIYTHCHVDHFAGIRGVVTDEQVASGAVRVIGPEGFLEHAVSENVIAGTAMSRRALYMYGLMLPKDARGHVDTGLGRAVAGGTWGLVPPTETVRETGTELLVDGVRMVFQVTPGTEAPAEMNFLLPDHRALCLAENCTAVQHNLYTPRGAEVRDALAWSGYIDEALRVYAPAVDVVFASHHWPRWGEAEIASYLTKQRDAYRYLHDQSMRLANQGLVAAEIAEELELPPGLADEFFLRDYYGTVNHNAKAVYQKYLGWFDANPAHLHPLPQVEAARRYVAYMGGADAVLARAREDFAAGDYRWVAEVVNHVVFADPANAAARALQADTLEQLGYQAESGPWRDFYLTGAQELRQGTPNAPGLRTPLQPDVLRGMPGSMLLDYLAVRLDGPRAARRTLGLALRLSDAGTTHRVELSHGTLHHTRVDEAADAVSLDRATLARLADDPSLLEAALADGSVAASAETADDLRELLKLLVAFDLFFPVIEP